jgi:hypothetical protein
VRQLDKKCTLFPLTWLISLNGLVQLPLFGTVHYQFWGHQDENCHQYEPTLQASQLNVLIYFDIKIP